MSTELLQKFPIGTLVAYADNPDDTFEVIGYDESDNTGYPIRSKPTDGSYDEEPFSLAEFADGRVIVVSVPEKADSSWNESLIALAIKFDRTISFRYVKADSSLGERQLAPDHITETKAGQRLVVGVDLDRDDVRAYRLDRIKGDVTV